MTVMFPHRTPAGLTLAFRKRQEQRRKLDAFADLLAEGVAVSTAARQLGFDHSYGRILLKKLCDGLGEQAR